MKNTKTEVNGLSIYWLFNTPYRVKIDGVMVTRHHAKKITPEVISAVLTDGTICAFINRTLPYLCALEDPTNLAIRATSGKFHTVEFFSREGLRVAVHQVYVWINGYAIYGYRDARAISLFEDICKGTPISLLCDQWEISRSRLCQIVDVLIRRIKYPGVASCDKADFKSKGSTIKALLQEPGFWKQRIEDLKQDIPTYR